MVIYLHSADHNSTTVRKISQDFARELDFGDIKLSIKTRDIHKIDKTNCIGIKVFNYQKKEKCPIYMSKKDMLIYYWYDLLCSYNRF